MTDYTLEQLVAIGGSNASPDARAIAVRMAYTMGQRDQKLADLARLIATEEGKAQVAA